MIRHGTLDCKVYATMTGNPIYTLFQNTMTRKVDHEDVL